MIFDFLSHVRWDGGRGSGWVEGVEGKMLTIVWLVREGGGRGETVEGWGRD